MVVSRSYRRHRGLSGLSPWSDDYQPGHQSWLRRDKPGGGHRYVLHRLLAISHRSTGTSPVVAKTWKLVNGNFGLPPTRRPRVKTALLDSPATVPGPPGKAARY